MKKNFTKTMGMALLLWLCMGSLFAQNQTSRVLPKVQAENLTLQTAPPTRAATPIFSETFDVGGSQTDSQVPPTTWTIRQGGSSTLLWRRTVETTHKNSAGAAYAPNGSVTNNFADIWFISPRITIPATGVYVLEFWSLVYPYESYGRRCTVAPFTNDTAYNRVHISTTNTETSSFTKIKQFTYEEVSIGAWKKTVLSLAGYAGQSIYIGFQYTGVGPASGGTNPGTNHRWYLDDVKVYERQQNDLEIIAGYYTQVPTTQILPPLSAEVENMGLTTQTNVNMAVTLDGSSLGTPFQIASLANDATTPVLTITPTGQPTLGAHALVYTATSTQGATATTTLNFAGTTNTLALDDSQTGAGGIGATGGNITMGNIFQITATTMLTEVRMGFSNSSDTQRYTISLYQMQGNNLTCVLPAMFTTSPIRRVANFSTQTVPSTLLTPGRYFLCITETDPRTNIGLLQDFNTTKSVCMLSGDSLYPQSNFGAAAIRMILSDPYTKDAAVIAITSPTATSSTSYIVKARIRNNSNTPITSMNVAYKLNNGTPVVQSFTGNLAAGAYTDFTFTTPVTPTAGFHNTLEVYTALSGDQNPANDSKTVELMYNPAPLTLYGYRSYDNLDSPDGIVSFSTSNPATVTSVNGYTDGDNGITTGAFFNDNLYLRSRDPENYAPRNFIKLSTATWTPVTTPITATAYSMTYDYATNSMFAYAYQNTQINLVKMNITTGALITTVGNTARDWAALACHRNGTLYGVDANGNFCRINTSTGAVTEIGHTGINPYYLQSMTFDHNSGRLLWAMYNTDAEGKLMEIDPTTGKAYDYGTLGHNTQVLALYTLYTHTVEIKDAEITAITSPISGPNLTATEHVTATIRNNGNSPISGFGMELTVDNGAPVTETYTGTIAPGATQNYTFTATADLSTVNTTYRIKVRVILAGDQNSSNDSKIVSITHTQGQVEPLTVTAYTPAENATGVSLNTEVSVTFSRNISENSLAGITINNVAANATISGNKLIIAHADFVSGTEYIVAIPANTIVDYNQLIQWKFTTSPLGIATMENNLLIYPNPTSGKLTIDNGQSVIDNIEIFDILGQNVQSNRLVHSSAVTMDVSHLPAGIYLVKVESNGKISTHKLVIGE